MTYFVWGSSNLGHPSSSDSPSSAECVRVSSETGRLVASLSYLNVGDDDHCMRRRELLVASVPASLSVAGCLRLQGSGTGSSTSTSEPDVPFFEVLVVNEESTLISVITTEHVASTGRVRERERGYTVQVRLTEAGADRFARRIVENTNSARIREHPLFVRVEGDSVSRFLISRAFLETMQSEDFQGTFQVTSENREELRPLAREL